MGYREDEKRWKRIQELLAAEASGKPVRPLVSQRTLFGIPSTVEQTIERIVAERGRVAAELAKMDGVEVFPSEANYLFIRFAGAHEAWERMYQEHSVLVRDFSGGAATKDCLRVSIGSPEENDRFLAALAAVRSGR